MDLARIDRYLDDVAEHFDRALGGRLASAHKIGSLAHGGFSPSYSDIDLALILDSQPPDALMRDAIQAACKIDPELGPRLSVFWSNTRFEFGRFPILDRADLVEHAVCVFGTPIDALEPPLLADVRAYLVGHPLDYWTEKTAHFHGATHVDDGERKEFVRCLLYPARLLYTWDTGKLTSNDAAVSYLEERSETGDLDLEPILQALACRNGDVTFESLLDYSPNLRSQHQATLQLIGKAEPA